jgi:hypothetical protein
MKLLLIQYVYRKTTNQKIYIKKKINQQTILKKPQNFYSKKKGL